jgi:hypothetical protein
VPLRGGESSGFGRVGPGAAPGRPGVRRPSGSPGGRDPSGLPGLAARLLFIKEQSQFHPERLSDVPQRQDSGVALAQFQSTDVGAIHTHPRCKLSLREARCDSQPPHIPPHHAPHVFRHVRM